MYFKTLGVVHLHSANSSCHSCENEDRELIKDFLKERGKYYLSGLLSSAY